MIKHFKQYSKLYLFFIMAYAISWLSLLFGDESYSFPWFLAKFGFSLSAIIMLLVFKDKNRTSEIVSYVKQSVSWKFVLLALFPVLAYFVSIVIMVPLTELSIVTGEGIGSWLYIILVAPGSGILFYSLFRGGMGEEIGLRAYVLPLIANKKSLLKTALIIGVVWSVWHYPVWIPSGLLNVVAGTLATIAWSFIFTLVFAKTKSLWIVILLHATSNAADDIMEFIFPNIIDYDWEIIYILIVLLVGIVSMLILRKTTNDFYQKQIHNNE